MQSQANTHLRPPSEVSPEKILRQRIEAHIPAALRRARVRCVATTHHKKTHKRENQNSHAPQCQPNETPRSTKSRARNSQRKVAKAQRESDFWSLRLCVKKRSSTRRYFK